MYQHNNQSISGFYEALWYEDMHIREALYQPNPYHCVPNPAYLSHFRRFRRLWVESPGPGSRGFGNVCQVEGILALCPQALGLEVEKVQKWPALLAEQCDP